MKSIKQLKALSLLAIIFMSLNVNAKSLVTTWPLKEPTKPLLETLLYEKSTSSEIWLKRLNKMDLDEYWFQFRIPIVRDLSLTLRKLLRKKPKNSVIEASQLQRHIKNAIRRSRDISKQSPQISKQRAVFSYLVMGLLLDQTYFTSGIQLEHAIEQIRKAESYLKEATKSFPEIKGRLRWKVGIRREFVRLVLNLYDRFLSTKLLALILPHAHWLDHHWPSDKTAFRLAKSYFHQAYWLSSTTKHERTVEIIKRSTKIAKAVLQNDSTLFIGAGLEIHPKRVRRQIRSKKFQNQVSKFLLDVERYLQNFRRAKEARIPVLGDAKTRQVNATLLPNLDDKTNKESQSKKTSNISEIVDLQEYYFYTVPNNGGFLWELAKKDAWLKQLPLQEHIGNEAYNDQVRLTWKTIRDANKNGVTHWLEPLPKKLVLRFPLYLWTRSTSASTPESIEERFEELGEDALIKIYRQAIQIQITRLKSTKPVPLDAVVRIACLKTLLDRKNPALTLSELKYIYELSQDDSVGSLRTLSAMLNLEERIGILEGCLELGGLEFAIDWFARNHLVSETKLDPFRRKLLKGKINDILNGTLTTKALSDEKATVFNFIKSYLVSNPLDQTQTLKQLQSLLALCEKAENQGVSTLGSWFKWMGPKMIWNALTGIDDETLFCFSKSESKRLKNLLTRALKQKWISRTHYFMWLIRIEKLKVKKIIISKKATKAAKHIIGHIQSSDLNNIGLRALKKLQKSIAARYPRPESLLKPYRKDEKVDISIKMTPEVFSDFRKRSPGLFKSLDEWIDDIDNDTKIEKQKSRKEKWTKLKRLSDVYEKLQKKRDLSGLDPDKRKAYQKIIEKLKSQNLDYESIERLGKLDEVLSGDASDSSILADLVEWIGPEALAEWLKDMDPSTLLSFAKLFSWLGLDEGELDLRRFGPLLKSIAKALSGLNFSGSKDVESYLNRWKEKSDNVLRINLGFKLPRINFGFDFPNLWIKFKNLFSGPDLYSIDYDFDDYIGERPDPGEPVSTEIQHAFANDVTLHKWNDSDYQNSSFSYSLKAAKVLLEMDPLENILVYTTPFYDNISSDELERRYKFDERYRPTSEYRDESPHLTWLSQLHDQSSDYWLESRNSAKLQLPKKVKMELLHSSYQLANHFLDWIHKRAVLAKRSSKGQSFPAIQYTLAQLNLLFQYLNNIYQSLYMPNKELTNVKLNWAFLGKKWASTYAEWFKILLRKRVGDDFRSKTFKKVSMVHGMKGFVRLLHSALKSQPKKLDQTVFPGLYQHELPEEIQHLPVWWVPHLIKGRPLTPFQRMVFYSKNFDPFLEYAIPGDPSKGIPWIEAEFRARYRSLTSPLLRSGSYYRRKKAEDDRAISLELLLFRDPYIVEKLPEKTPEDITRKNRVKQSFRRNIVAGFRKWKESPPLRRRYSFLWPTYWAMSPDILNRFHYIINSSGVKTVGFGEVALHFIKMLSVASLTEENQKELLQIFVKELDRLQNEVESYGLNRWARVITWNSLKDALIWGVRDYKFEFVVPIFDQLVPLILEKSYLKPKQVVDFIIKLSEFFGGRYREKAIQFLHEYFSSWDSRKQIPRSGLGKLENWKSALARNLPLISRMRSNYLAGSRRSAISIDRARQELRRFNRSRPKPKTVMQIALALYSDSVEKRYNVYWWRTVRKIFYSHSYGRLEHLDLMYLILNRAYVTSSSDKNSDCKNIDCGSIDITYPYGSLTRKEKELYRLWDSNIQNDNPLNKTLLTPGVFPPPLKMIFITEGSEGAEATRKIFFSTEFPNFTLYNDNLDGFSLVKGQKMVTQGAEFVSRKNEKPSQKYLENDLRGIFSMVSHGELLRYTHERLSKFSEGIDSQLIQIQLYNQLFSSAGKEGFYYLSGKGYRALDTTKVTRIRDLFRFWNNGDEPNSDEENMLIREKLSQGLSAELLSKTFGIQIGSSDGVHQFNYQFKPSLYSIKSIDPKGIPIDWGTDPKVVYEPTWLLNILVFQADREFSYKKIEKLYPKVKKNIGDTTELLTFDFFQAKRQIAKMVQEQGPNDNPAVLSARIENWIQVVQEVLPLEKQPSFFRKALHLIETWKRGLRSSPNFRLGYRMGEWLEKLSTTDQLSEDAQQKIIHQYKERIIKEEDNFAVGMMSALSGIRDPSVNDLKNVLEKIQEKKPKLSAQMHYIPWTLSSTAQDLVSREQNLERLGQANQDPIMRRWLQFLEQSQTHEKINTSTLRRWLWDRVNRKAGPVRELKRVLVLLREIRTIFDPSSVSTVNWVFSLTDWAIQLNQYELLKLYLPPKLYVFAQARLLERGLFEVSEKTEEELIRSHFYSAIRLPIMLGQETWNRYSSHFPKIGLILEQLLGPEWKPSWLNNKHKKKVDNGFVHSSLFMQNMRASKDSSFSLKLKILVVLNKFLKAVQKWIKMGNEPVRMPHSMTVLILELDEVAKNMKFFGQRDDIPMPMVDRDIISFEKKFSETITSKEGKEKYRYDDDFRQRIWRFSVALKMVTRELQRVF